MKKSFRDPVTGCLLQGFAMKADFEVPAERRWWGRKLGYTDEQIESMWLDAAHGPRYLDLSQLDRVLSKGEAEHIDARRIMTGE